MKIHNGSIVFDNGFVITLHRTIRLPEDGKSHALPPSMGSFPMKRIEDYQDKVPASWKDHGGVFFPMHEREAMWLAFGGPTSAVKVATGKVNAVSGGKWTQELQPPTGVDGKDPEQDYMVGPQPQPWLDGFNIGGGQIRQFVGMAMGKGYTVEAQVTGKEDVGGIQVLVVPAKPNRLPTVTTARRSASGSLYKSSTYTSDGILESASGDVGGVECLSSDAGGGFEVCSAAPASAAPVSYKQASSVRAYSMSSTRSGPAYSPKAKLNKSAEIGLAQGGRMTQVVYADPHGIDVWDQEKAERIFLHIVNAELWEQITGEKCPDSPVPASSYAGAYYTYENGHDAIKGSGTLANVKPVSEKDKDHGFVGQQDDSVLSETTTNVIVNLKGSPPAKPTNEITDGKW